MISKVQVLYLSPVQEILEGLVETRRPSLVMPSLIYGAVMLAFGKLIRFARQTYYRVSQ